MPKTLKKCSLCEELFPAWGSRTLCDVHNGRAGKSYQEALALSKSTGVKDITLSRYSGLVSRHLYRCEDETPLTCISFDRYRELISVQCTYCSNSATSVDRIDSSKGYTLTNTQSICKRCNTAKWDLTEEDFLNHIANIYVKSCQGK